MFIFDSVPEQISLSRKEFKIQFSGYTTFQIIDTTAIRTFRECNPVGKRSGIIAMIIWMIRLDSPSHTAVRAKPAFWRYFKNPLSAKEKGVKLLMLNALHVVAGIGFEPMTFRL